MLHPQWGKIMGEDVDIALGRCASEPESLDVKPYNVSSKKSSNKGIFNFFFLLLLFLVGYQPLYNEMWALLCFVVFLLVLLDMVSLSIRAGFPDCPLRIKWEATTKVFWIKHHNGQCKEGSQTLTLPKAQIFPSMEKHVAVVGHTRREHQISLWVVVNHPPCGCWDLNSGSSEEQSGL